jgi:hypothetical protein
MRVTDIQVDPRPVAFVRVGVGLAVLLNAFEVAAILQRVADGRLRFPVFARLPAPTAVSIDVYLPVAVLAGVALVVGYHAATAAAVSSVLGVVALLWDQQTYSNHRVLVTLLVTFLVFARSDAALSVWRRRPHQAAVPWWPQLLMMTQLSACYLFAALSKVNPVYLDGEPFAFWLWMSLPSALLPVVAVASVLTELFLAVGLWFRATRYVAAAAGVALHVSIVLGMSSDNVALFAFACACVPVYGLFLTRPSLRDVGSPAEVVDEARTGSVKS